MSGRECQSKLPSSVPVPPLGVGTEGRELASVRDASGREWTRDDVSGIRWDGCAASHRPTSSRNTAQHSSCATTLVYRFNHPASSGSSTARSYLQRVLYPLPFQPFHEVFAMNRDDIRIVTPGSARFLRAKSAKSRRGAS